MIVKQAEPGVAFARDVGTLPATRSGGSVIERRGPLFVAGLGLIGGSVARAALRSGYRVFGTSERETDRHRAEAAGISCPSGEREMRAALAGAPTVVLAVPLDGLRVVAEEVLARASPTASILHTCSLQRAEAIDLAPQAYRRVLGTHPLAGSTTSGFAASTADLFRGATVSVESRADAASRAAAEVLWSDLGATRVEYRSAEEHDVLMSWVSHLPQLVATALAGTLAHAGIQPASCGPGARDTTRLALSPLAMWAPILAVAPRETTEAIAVLESRLAALRRAIEGHDATALNALWRESRDWRSSMERPE